MLGHGRCVLEYLPGLRSYLCFSQSTHCRVLLQEAAAEQQQETHGSISWPEPCQLQQMALGCRGMAGKLEVCSLPLPTLPECWWPLRRGRRVAAWGVLAQQVSSQLRCGTKPYSIRSRSSGWRNTKQRSAARAQEWDPEHGDTKLHSCPLPCEKGKCCATGLSKKNKELDILLKGNQNLELAKQ